MFTVTVSCRSESNSSVPDFHCTVYSAATGTASQVTARLVSPAVTFRFSGVSGAGTCGMPVSVADQSLSPPALAARTRSV